MTHSAVAYSGTPRMSFIVPSADVRSAKYSGSSTASRRPNTQIHRMVAITATRNFALSARQPSESPVRKPAMRPISGRLAIRLSHQDHDAGAVDPESEQEVVLALPGDQGDDRRDHDQDQAADAQG